ncbi:deoxyuridine 5'-triphosphate nucleotidohydrolase [Candidatus Omnitrophota bacterium]
MLNRREIEELIRDKELVSGFMDLDKQLTPNGFDLTVESIFEFDAQGALDFSNKERVVPKGKALSAQKIKTEDKFGWWDLKKGGYKVRTNEVVNLSNDLTALAFARTSLLRIGGFTQHGVWDAGFRGRGEFILIVENPNGVRIKQNARIAQLIFLPIEKIDKGYEGIYKERK